MIGYIKGKIIGKNEQSLLLENNGIGYRVFSTPQVLTIDIGQEIELHTHLQVREDAFNLFGFQSPAELAFFELLTTVSGVGPKVALSVLSAGDLELIKGAIVSQDAAVFTKVGGVGKKTAERIIMELKEKLSGSFTVTGLGKSDDLLGALEQLGYSVREIKEVLNKIDHTLPTEEKLKQALKYLGK
ncbi:MAG: holliday junction ATP-dependent DNA helicase RuvA [Candidatus Doudnabacteria bacterium Gr01-1014_77]|uniref:Holliday junction branch migration complex subunit RuvA n=1 Tax=Candidatus Doudnabacteria bacterium Gr01-1014_77 TaxID=2017133 RepID=A0A554JCB6_9BACT|nr:MAG: holliday junction ATP-dependent DNA helicase RuvA [Candidatus Doudnabacteria bacterium Gr01-1014_77]